MHYGKLWGQSPRQSVYVSSSPLLACGEFRAGSHAPLNNEFAGSSREYVPLIDIIARNKYSRGPPEKFRPSIIGEPMFCDAHPSVFLSSSPRTQSLRKYHGLCWYMHTSLKRSSRFWNSSCISVLSAIIAQHVSLHRFTPYIIAQVRR